ncbi:MAG TPA: hypothetical protein VG960_09300 [Caulobacteraceae bacterium]|nr:hypothetical protein [Caulobacteraceae bacterium]
MKTITLLCASVAACLIALGAAAKEDEPLTLFISPCGEPFFGPQSQPYPIVTWFKQVDANADGKIDRDEFRADAEHFFKKLDRDGDGVLNSDEVYIYENVIVPEILNRDSASLRSGVIRASLQDDGGAKLQKIQDSGDGTDTPPKPVLTNQGAAFFGLFNDPEPVMSADRNFDFRISHKEFIDQSDRHFARLDVKGRGYFTLDDLPKTPAEAYFHLRRTPAR